MIEYESYSGSVSDAVLSEVVPIFEGCFGFPAPADHLRRVRHYPGLLLLVARARGEVIAYKAGYAREVDVFYSWLGGVRDDYRRQGIARELMKRQHRWCEAHGFRQVLTETRVQFKPMLLLNLQSGFEVTGTSLDESGCLAVLLSKTLGAG